MENEELIIAINQLARAVYQFGAIPTDDATGGHVTSFTEAMMGQTAALVKIADAIIYLADAMGEGKHHPQECAFQSAMRE